MMAIFNTYDVICFALMGLSTVICAVFVIIHWLHFMRLSSKKMVFVRLRYPSLISIINTIACIIILLERPFICIIKLLFLNKKYIVLQLVGETIHCLTLFAFLCCICIKFYLSYFIKQLNLALINQTWKREINIGISGLYALRNVQVLFFRFKHVACCYSCLYTRSTDVCLLFGLCK